MRGARWAGLAVGVGAVLAVVGASLAQGDDAAPKARVEGVTIATPRGLSLEGTLHVPAKGNGVGVVLAPGQGYSREKPLISRGAQALAAAGFVVLRFDWGYFPTKGRPSEDLSLEAEDLEAAIVRVRAVEGVKKVLIAGKSLGSLVVLARAARKSDDLAGVALLTFPMHAPSTPAARTEGIDRLAGLSVPTLVVQGDRDPLGGLAMLYGLAASAATPPRIVVVPGDHSFREGEAADARSEENVGFAVEALVLWARRFAGT